MLVEEVLNSLKALGAHQLQSSTEIAREAYATARIALRIPIGIIRQIETQQEIILLAAITATAIALTTLIYTKADKKTKRLSPLLISSMLIFSAIWIGGFNAKFTDRETRANTFTAGTNFLKYTIHGGKATYTDPNQNRTLGWIRNDHIGRNLEIEDIQISSFNPEWTTDLWASETNSEASDGEPRNTTIGPSEKRWIWMRTTAPNGDYQDVKVALTVNSTHIDLPANISVDR